MDQQEELSERSRKERLAAALVERRRRDDLRIERAADGAWCDLDTREPLTEEQVMKREIAHERARPPAVDLQNKVIVDRQWLRETLGIAAFDEACEDKHIKSLREWM